MNEENNFRVRIGIVLLNYQTWEDTLKVIDNLKLQEDVDLVFSVVDNNSPNNSYKFLKEYTERSHDIDIILTKSESNDGYAKGNNLGLKRLLEKKCQYVIIMNNDVYIDNYYMLSNLAKLYPTLKSPGFISPIQLTLNRQIYRDYYRIPSFIYDLASISWLTRKIRSFLWKNEVIKRRNSKFIPVEVFTGCFIFTDYSMFKSLEFFDEDTFLFGEERFWGTKLKLVGKQCYIIPSMTYIHAHSKTINTYVATLRKWQFLNDAQIKFTKKYRKFPKLKSFVLKISFEYTKFELKIRDKLRLWLNRKNK